MNHDTIIPCETPGCDGRAVTADHLLCLACESARYYIGDDEGELIAAGVSVRDGAEGAE